MMPVDVRFLVWFALYWALLLGWRVYRHWRGDRHSFLDWSIQNLMEWGVFFTIWLLVLR